MESEPLDEVVLLDVVLEELVSELADLEPPDEL